MTHIPDFEKIFNDELNMDLRNSDVRARVIDYFMVINKIMEDRGLTSILGKLSRTRSYYAKRAKLRCKLLMVNLSPVMLKVEIERLAITDSRLEENEVTLYIVP
ncbi:hypothetical protein PsorP6_016613 [Peronosclerospora sorghi]|uniref:Uncharacterized protein n=1 Tax=Peronosclerospora sorghi TaxID=230839 RepID=A0ACC0VL75_9STRA|nr:hypothetical protein PsorP6_016613 [Peronosclerospora sorghi]